MTLFSKPATLFISLVLLGAACSPETATNASLVDEPASDSAASSSINFEASYEFLQTVGERMTTTPHRFELFFPDDAQAEAGIDGPVARGEFDGTWAAAMMMVGPPTQPGGDPTTDEPVSTTISNGTDIYLYMPGATQFGASSMNAVNSAASQGWVVVRGAEIEERLGADAVPSMTPSTFATEDDVFAPLEHALTISAGPASTSRGVETQIIIATYDPLAVLEASGEDTEFAEIFYSGKTPEERAETISIEIDADGLVRSIQESTGRIEFFDFDAEISINVASDARDMTEEWIQLSGG